MLKVGEAYQEREIRGYFSRHLWGSFKVVFHCGSFVFLGFSLIFLSNWKPKAPGSLGSLKGNIGISEEVFLKTFQAFVFCFSYVFLCFSFVFLSKWNPRDPGFPGNQIGNQGVILELF